MADGIVITFFGPGCWMWQTNDDEGDVQDEGVASSMEHATLAAKAALASREQRVSAPANSPQTPAPEEGR